MADLPLSDIHIRTLRKCQPEIVKALDINHIHDVCISEEIVSKEMMEDVLKKGARIKVCREFLTTLESRSIGAFNSFVTALKVDYGFLAKSIEWQLWEQTLTQGVLVMRVANNVGSTEDGKEKLVECKQAWEELYMQIEELMKKFDIHKDAGAHIVVDDKKDLPMTDVHKRTLQSCHAELVEELDVKDIIEICYQEDAVTRRMKDKIMSLTLRTERCVELLDWLENRTVNAFNCFVNALKTDYDFLARSLEEQLWEQTLHQARGTVKMALNIAPATLHDDKLQFTESKLQELALLSKQLMLMQSHSEPNSPEEKNQAPPLPPKPPAHLRHAKLLSSPQLSTPVHVQEDTYENLQKDFALNKTDYQSDGTEQDVSLELCTHNSTSSSPDSASNSGQLVKQSYSAGDVNQDEGINQPSRTPVSVPSEQDSQDKLSLSELSVHASYYGENDKKEHDSMNLQHTTKVSHHNITAKNLGECDIIQSICTLVNNNIIIIYGKFEQRIFGIKREISDGFALLYDIDSEKEIRTLVKKTAWSVASTEEIVAVGCTLKNSGMVKLFDISGKHLRDINLPSIKQPDALAFNLQQELVVADQAKTTVAHVNVMTGKIVDETQPGMFKKHICSIAVNKDNNVLIGDADDNSVRLISRHGDTLSEYRGEEDHTLDKPWGVCIDDLGNIIIADRGNHRVQLLSPEGHFIKHILDSDGLLRPVAVAINNQGDLVVAVNCPPELFVVKYRK